MSYTEIINITALYALAGAMRSIGIDPVDQSFRYSDCGQYRIYMLQGVYDYNRHQLDANIVTYKLHNYFKRIPKLYPRLGGYEVSPYGCLQPDSGKLILFISIEPA